MSRGGIGLQALADSLPPGETYDRVYLEDDTAAPTARPRPPSSGKKQAAPRPHALRAVVHRLTKNGYESKAGDGGLPRYLQGIMGDYKLKAGAAKQGTCARHSFFPFKARDGSLYASAIEDGVPVPSRRKPVFLVLALNEVGRIAGHMLLFDDSTSELFQGRDAWRGAKVLKLEYICGALGAKGVGEFMLGRKDDAATRAGRAYYEKLGFQKLMLGKTVATRRLHGVRDDVSLYEEDVSMPVMMERTRTLARAAGRAPRQRVVIPEHTRHDRDAVIMWKRMPRPRGSERPRGGERPAASVRARAPPRHRPLAILPRRHDTRHGHGYGLRRLAPAYFA